MTTVRLRMDWNRNAERELLSQPDVRDFVQRVGDDVATSVRDQAPVDTGELRDGVENPEMELQRDGWHAFVNFLTWYSLIVEYGPRGRPFIRPGADSALRRHGSRLEGDRK
jgi:hypothetical protein